MYRNPTSDSDLAMAASLWFEGILNDVQESNLNFRIERSPFSAVIYLKKTFVQSRLGNFVTPPPSKSVIISSVKSENLSHAKKIEYLENTIESMKRDHENVVLECEACYTTISKLEDQINVGENDTSVGFKKEPVDDEIVLEATKHEEAVKGLRREKESLEIKLAKNSAEFKSLKQAIDDLTKENEVLERSMKKIKKESKDSEHDFVKKTKLFGRKYQKVE